MTRMRYKRVNNQLMNARPLKNLHNHEIVLYIKGLSAEIVNMDMKQVTHITANNIAKLKRLVKLTLIKQEGIKFKDEIRKKKKSF